MDQIKLTPNREAALIEIAEETVTYQGFPVQGKPYYLINGKKDTSKTATFDFLRAQGLARFDNPGMRATKVITTAKGADWLLN